MLPWIHSSDGHDGLVKDGKILNDETLDILGKMSLRKPMRDSTFLDLPI